MNTTNLIGRLARDPMMKRTEGENPMAIARFSLAVSRPVKKDGQAEADFISCIAFGKTAEIIEKYCKKGSQIGVVGRIQTGSYEKEGQKIYTTDVVVNQMFFCGSKSEENSSNNANGSGNQPQAQANGSQNDSVDGFMNIPDDMDEIPFV